MQEKPAPGTSGAIRVSTEKATRTLRVLWDNGQHEEPGEFSISSEARMEEVAGSPVSETFYDLGEIQPGA